MIALSSSWYSLRSPEVKKMLPAIKDTGITALEVGYNFSAAQLRELRSLIPESGMQVVSVHNFCPAPDKVPGRFFTDYYRISSLDAHERAKAVEYTKRSIDTARAFSAAAVVLHAGTVELSADYMKTLMKLYAQGNYSSEEFIRVRAQLREERARKKPAHLDATLKSLEEILSYARDCRVAIGLETRYYPQEIPDFEEIGYLLRLFSDKGLRYWHDAGHAEVNARLGFSSHQEYFTRYGSSLIGIHLHDVVGLQDHLAPFTGTLDYRMIHPYLTPELITVIEAHPPASVAQIKKAVALLTAV